ncbi:GPCR fungal pheromone mating factor [Mycena rebaudengoi]|nr:GPCR fungal pheromone mating factor [Mycena rebaudengoi]
MPGAFPAAAFIGAALVLIPLSVHWRARNVLMLSIMAWLFVSDLTYGINSVIWRQNIDIVVPAWCDITTKIKVGSDIALPAACLCLALQLYRVAYSMQVPQKSRFLVLDLTLSLGLPFLIMALHYVVQGHRFDIMENIGCTPAIYVSVPSIILLDIPPLVCAALALVFASLALVKFSKRRTAFSRMVQSSNSGLSTSRYVRLMGMSFSLGVWNAICISVSRSSMYVGGLNTWTNWADVHADFSIVSQYPDSAIPSQLKRSMTFTWWAVPISSLLLFCFFAFGEEAMKEYISGGNWIKQTITNRSKTSTGHSVSTTDSITLGVHEREDEDSFGRW